MIPDLVARTRQVTRQAVYNIRMKNKLFISSTAALVFGSFIFATPASATTINVAKGSMNFGATSGTNQPDMIGDNAGLGFSHRYNDVFAGVDAVATVIDVQNIDEDDDQSNGADLKLDAFDDDDSETGPAIDAKIDIFGNSGDPELNEEPELQTGSMTFRIDFVEADTTKAVTLQNIAMRVFDIDNRQFAKFAGITSYKLSATPPTELVASSENGVFEFKEPVGGEADPSHEENWVAVEFAEASTLTITLGARQSGGATFGVEFADTNWTDTPNQTTADLVAYTLTYDANESESGAVPASQSSTVSSPIVTLAAPQGDLANGECEFDGWNTRTDGTGSNFLDTETITLTANTTLYAQWDCGAPVEEETNPGEELADTGETTDWMTMTALFAIVAGAVLFALGRRKRA
jgi:LPXTG-motif cell wall-anchored protein